MDDFPLEEPHPSGDVPIAVREAGHLGLRPAHRRRLMQELAFLQDARAWNGQVPVVLLERCWLRMSVVPLDRLGGRLPPDASGDAPELVRFRELRSTGLDSWAAQQQCWQEFGADACQDALRRLWRARERGNHGWTLDRYLRLVRDYRRKFERRSPRSLPVLILARADRREAHRLVWLIPPPP